MECLRSLVSSQVTILTVVFPAAWGGEKKNMKRLARSGQMGKVGGAS